MALERRPGLRCYLVEGYWPGLGELGGEEAARTARRAASRMREADEELRYLGVLLIPGDEVAFCLFTAPSEAALDEAARRAGLPVDRVVEVVEMLEPRDS
jgi:hypothetical protein